MNTKYSVFKFLDQALKKFHYDFNEIFGWLPYADQGIDNLLQEVGCQTWYQIQFLLNRKHNQ